MTSLPRTPGIYIITCLPTGKIYVGSSINLRKRWNMHRRELRSGVHCNQYLQRAWNKYGEIAFTFEILELVMPWGLIDREQYWIDKLSPFDERGFNIVPNAGSTLGRKVSEETKAKMRVANKGRLWSPERRTAFSAANKGNKYALGNKVNLGRIQSPETRAKRSAALKGNKNSLGYKHSEEARANMSAARKSKSK